MRDIEKKNYVHPELVRFPHHIGEYLILG